MGSQVVEGAGCPLADSGSSLLLIGMHLIHLVSEPAVRLSMIAETFETWTGFQRKDLSLDSAMGSSLVTSAHHFLFGFTM